MRSGRGGGWPRKRERRWMWRERGRRGGGGRGEGKRGSKTFFCCEVQSCQAALVCHVHVYPLTRTSATIITGTTPTFSSSNFIPGSEPR
eukprot:761363-Hanusia_phi.AAC.4